jgi:predicted nucleotidyltransferase
MLPQENQLYTVIANQPYPLLFATLSGAHLYGFPSPDSDYDLRGSHILPVPEVIKLDPGRETIEFSALQNGLEIDLVTHDIKKFFTMLLKKNGYVLEQLYSPLVIKTTPEHEELKEIAKGCLTPYHSYHYLGFARTEWGLFIKENPPRVKPLLYVYRVLLTGIYLMKTGVIECNLLNLNKVFQLPYIPDLINQKVEGKEKAFLAEAELTLHQREYERLANELEEASQVSSLRKSPSVKNELNALLVRLRLKDLCCEANLEFRI